jgi:hypothetical protein
VVLISRIAALGNLKSEVQHTFNFPLRYAYKRRRTVACQIIAQHLQSATAPGTLQRLFSKLKRPANIVAMEFQSI